MPPPLPSPDAQLTLLPTESRVRAHAARPGRRVSLQGLLRQLAEELLPGPVAAAAELRRERALRQRIARRAAAEPTSPFAQAMSRPGLRAALAEWLGSLRTAGAVAADLTAATAEAAPFAQFAELAAECLPGGAEPLSDPRDQPWRLAAALEAGRPLPTALAGVAALAVEEFDLLPPGPRALLSALVARGLGLHWHWPLPTALVARLPALADQRSWLAELAARFPDRVRESTLSPSATPSPAASRARPKPRRRPTDEAQLLLGLGGPSELPTAAPTAAAESDLSHFRAGLFAAAGPRSAADSGGADGSVCLLRAPDAAAEADLIAHEIRRRLRVDPSARPAHFAVICSEPTGQRPLLLERLSAAGLPSWSPRGPTLSALPVFRYVRKLLELPIRRFETRAVLAVLQSSYSPFRARVTLPADPAIPGPPPTPTVDGAALELLLDELGYRGGEAESLAARMARRARDVELSRQELRDRAAGQTEQPSDPARLAESLARLDRQLTLERAMIAAMEEHLAPLRDWAEPASLSARASTVLGLLDGYVRRSSGPTASRDARTLTGIRRLLSEQAAEAEPSTPVGPAEWLDELDLLAGRRSLGGIGSPDGVAVLSLSEAAGGSWPTVIVPGLLQQRFPRLESPQPMITDRQRSLLSAALTARGLPPLREPSEAAEVDRVLFARAAFAAERVLILSAPVTSESQEDRPPSEFFREAERLLEPTDGGARRLPQRSVTLREPVAELAEVASRAALHTRVALELFEPRRAVPPTSSAVAAVYAQLCRAQPTEVLLWQRAAAVGRARASALLGEPTGQAHRFSGLFDGAAGEAIRAALRHDDGAAEPGPAGGFAESSTVVTAVGLETFGKCPFRFVLEQVVRLRPLRRPEEEEFDAISRGRLVHRVLERYYRDETRRARMPAPTADRAVLAELAEEEMSRFAGGRLATATAQVRTVAAALQARLESFLDADAEHRRQHGSRPVALELPLAGVAVPASVGLALPLRIHGRIDRLDLDGEGRPMLIDYKNSSRTADEAEYRLGTMVQLGLYAIGLEYAEEGQLPKAEWAGGRPTSPRAAYYALKRRRGQIVQPVKLLERGDWRSPLLGHLRRYAAALAGGAFPVFPTARACEHCPWLSVCRRRPDGPVRVSESPAELADELGEA